MYNDKAIKIGTPVKNCCFSRIPVKVKKKLSALGIEIAVIVNVRISKYLLNYPY